MAVPVIVPAATGNGFTVTATVAVEGVFGQLPVGELVVIVADAGPPEIVGVKVAVTVDPTWDCPVMLPFVAPQLPRVAAPVKVPISVIELFAQTDCEVGETVTPLNEFTLIALDPFPALADIDPHGFIASTVMT